MYVSISFKQEKETMLKICNFMSGFYIWHSDFTFVNLAALLTGSSGIKYGFPALYCGHPAGSPVSLRVDWQQRVPPSTAREEDGQVDTCENPKVCFVKI